MVLFLLEIMRLARDIDTSKPASVLKVFVIDCTEKCLIAEQWGSCRDNYNAEI